MLLELFRKGRRIGSRVIKEPGDGLDYLSNGGPLGVGTPREAPSSFPIDQTFYPTSEGIEHLESQGEDASVPLRIMMSKNQTPRAYASSTLQGGYSASSKQLNESVKRAMQEGWITTNPNDAAL